MLAYSNIPYMVCIPSLTLTNTSPGYGWKPPNSFTQFWDSTGYIQPIFLNKYENTNVL